MPGTPTLDDGLDLDDEEALVRIWAHCTAAAQLIDPEAAPDLHAAMQALLNALGREMGRRMRDRAH